MAKTSEYVGELRRIADEIEYMKPGSAWVCREAAALIERLTKPFDPNSDEAFVVRALRSAAHRTDIVIIMSNDGENIPIECFGSYAAKPNSKAVLAVLDRLEEKEAARG